jgi:hypothetical protein
MLLIFIPGWSSDPEVMKTRSPLVLCLRVIRITRPCLSIVDVERKKKTEVAVGNEKEKELSRPARTQQQTAADTRLRPLESDLESSPRVKPIPLAIVDLCARKSSSWRSFLIGTSASSGPTGRLPMLYLRPLSSQFFSRNCG